MTKEELEKEAEEFTDSKKSFWRQGRTCIDSVKQAYIAGAEPREKRISELEQKVELWKKASENNSYKAFQFEQENTELKDKLNNLSKVAEVRLANWQKYEKAYNEAEELLDKQIEATYKVVEENKEAKEIIKKFSEFANLEVEYDPEHPQEHTDLWNELCKEAEQFLKECE